MYVYIHTYSISSWGSLNHEFKWNSLKNQPLPHRKQTAS